MVRCGLCGQDNPYDAAVCTRCGAYLEEDSAAPRSIPDEDPPDHEGATRRLPTSAGEAMAPKWGTASFGPERRILLHVRGHDRPLLVKVTGQVALGRYDMDPNQAADVDLGEFGALELGVSRRHVALLIADDALKIVDLGSANATFINGQRMIPHQARFLRDGDVLQLGGMAMRIQFV